MFFCPFCGTLLLVQARITGNVFVCSTCRYIDPVIEREYPLTVTHSFLAHNKAGAEEDEEPQRPGAAPTDAGATDSDSGGGGAVPTAEGAEEVGQIITIQCENDKAPCDSKKAHFVQLQMRSADEPPTTFFKCVKCGHQWRQD